MRRPGYEPPPLLREVRRQIGQSLARSDACGRETSGDVEAFDSARWASATFEGHRHRFVVRFDGPPDDVRASAARFRKSVSGDDIRLRGELLADILLVGEDHVAGEDDVVGSRLYFEALTVKD